MKTKLPSAAIATIANIDRILNEGIKLIESGKNTDGLETLIIVSGMLFLLVDKEYEQEV